MEVYGMGEVKSIGVLTSGGDAPGMNPAVRAVVRVAIAKGLKVYGIHKGYTGLLAGDIRELTARDVSEKIQRGGTFLQTARCKEMMQPDGPKKAAEMCRVFGIDAVVVIGGDGSFKGAGKIAKYGVNMIGIPGTIDLDIACTDYTIGFDTAVNTAMEAIDKIRDTSTSHERCSIVEVMGRDAGYIALWCGIVNGAEEILIPERKIDDNYDAIIKSVIQNKQRGKQHNLIIVAEGVGGSQVLADRIESVTGITTRVSILGYLQRGGSPTALDRMRASMMGAIAVDILVEGKSNRIVVFKDGKYNDVDLHEGLAMKKELSDQEYDISRLLETR
jgi:6-phosphofructokinase 1